MQQYDIHIGTLKVLLEMVKKKTQVSHCITRVTSTQVGWKKHHFLLNLSYVTLIKSFICSSRIELKYWIVDVCEEKDTRLPGWVSAHGEQSDERETSSGNCQHFQVLAPGLYPFCKIRPEITNIVLVKYTNCRIHPQYFQVFPPGKNMKRELKICSKMCTVHKEFLETITLFGKKAVSNSENVDIHPHENYQNGRIVYCNASSRWAIPCWFHNLSTKSEGWVLVYLGVSNGPITIWK